jgi:tRNA U34 5-carboxymethylaminomethyl modifying enzyme MnmG/GidA
MNLKNKLNQIRPQSFGQALRIPGVNASRYNGSYDTFI